MRPRLLDLFCGAGGAAKGYADAGFEVVGVDIEPQPNYPFQFHQLDALEYASGRGISTAFDAIHASPPCQGYTTMNNRHGSVSPLLIDDTRRLLEQTGLPYVIENVPGARRWMRSPVVLTGAQFGLGVHRPRLFESNVLLMAPGRVRRQSDAAAVYGKEDGRRLISRKDGSELRVATLEQAQPAMGIDWMEWRELCEAIPPAYTRFIGEQLMQHLKAVA